MRHPRSQSSLVTSILLAYAMGGRLDLAPTFVTTDYRRRFNMPEGLQKRCDNERLAEAEARRQRRAAKKGKVL